VRPAANEQIDDIVYDDEPDPMAMTEEEYFKAKEAYLKKVRGQSEKCERLSKQSDI
jgi:hypothetical protein